MKIIETTIGAKCYVMREENLEIAEGRISGIVQTDASRKLVKVYVELASSYSKTFDFILLETEDFTSSGGTCFSLNYSKIVNKRTSLKEAKAAKIVKEMRRLAKILIKVAPDRGTAKARILDVLGEM